MYPDSNKGTIVFSRNETQTPLSEWPYRVFAEGHNFVGIIRRNELLLADSLPFSWRTTVDELVMKE